MVSTYVPRNKFFAPTKIHRLAKNVMEECEVDRNRALETFDFFKGMVQSDPEDDKSKTEMVKSLQLSMDANDKKVKILDMMIKMTMQEEKNEAAKKKTSKDDDTSFESLKSRAIKKDV